MTRSGRFVRAAISVTERAEVLVARMSSGGQTRSSSWKIAAFSSRSSGTASITIWAASRAPRSSTVRMRARIGLLLGLGAPPLGDVAVEALDDLREGGARPASGVRSCSSTSSPAAAQAMAMPCPMVPPPTMPTARMFTARAATRRPRRTRGPAGPCCGTSRSARPASAVRGQRATARASWRSSTRSRVAEQRVGSTCAPPGGSGTISSTMPKRREVGGGDLHRRGRLFGPPGVAPEDRRAALGRDHRVDRVLEHVHAVADGDGQRAAAAALAGHVDDDRRRQARHLAQVVGDRLGLPALLGVQARGRRRACRRSVTIGPAELRRQLHHAQRLAVALRLGHAEVPVDLLLGVAALLVADDHHRPLLVEREAAHERGVVAEAPVAVQLGELGEERRRRSRACRAGWDGAPPASSARA